MKKSVFAIILFVLVVVFSGCNDQNDPEKYPPYTKIELDIPPHFPKVSIPSDNPMYAERVALGRYMYYSPTLSKGGPHEGKSCSSCHFQANAFTNASAKGVLPHINLAWNQHFLWNGKVSGSLEDIMRFELEDFFKVDINLLKANSDFVKLYEAAFHTNDITMENAIKAISQFFRVLHSTDSKFDRFIEGKEELTDEEYQGYLIFNSERGDCFHCHAMPLFTDNEFHNIGLETKFANHLGRYEITGNTGDVGSFKTPTLRNIEMTAPYMHDDRFTTLLQVVEHYNSGVLISPVLDPIMTKAGKETGLNLSDKEKQNLVAFLKTLTDNDFLTRQSLGSP